MASKATVNLERPVSFVTAAKKVAKIRGDYGKAGGWIYNKFGAPVCQGWDAYGKRVFSAGYIAQDADHGGGNGKWYVWVLGLTEAELKKAEEIFS